MKSMRSGSKQKAKNLRSLQDEGVYLSWTVPTTGELFSDALYTTQPGVSASRQAIAEGHYRESVLKAH